MTNPDKSEIKMETLRFVCSECSATGDCPEVETSGMDQDEVWDAGEPYMIAKGWEFIHNDEGRRKPLCPACVDTKVREKVSSLRVYQETGRCPKCNHDDVAVHYFTGKEARAVHRCEYMLRTCRRCQYIWCEKPLDFDEPTRES